MVSSMTADRIRTLRWLPMNLRKMRGSWKGPVLDSDCNEQTWMQPREMSTVFQKILAAEYLTWNIFNKMEKVLLIELSSKMGCSFGFTQLFIFSRNFKPGFLPKWTVIVSLISAGVTKESSHAYLCRLSGDSLHIIPLSEYQPVTHTREWISVHYLSQINKEQCKAEYFHFCF